MKKKRGILLIFLICLALGVVFVMTTRQPESADTLPSEARDLIETYMNAYKNGTAEAAEYIHFEDDFIKSAYIVAGDKLLDYKIESTEKINDNLYGLVVLVKTEQTTFYSGDIFERAYNFVGFFDGKWFYMNGVANIPISIRQNLDESKYTYNNENIVASDDIVTVIDDAQYGNYSRYEEYGLTTPQQDDVDGVNAIY